MTPVLHLGLAMTAVILLSAPASAQSPVISRKPVTLGGWTITPPEGPGWIAATQPGTKLFGKRHADFHTSIALARMVRADSTLSTEQLIERVHPATRPAERVPREQVTEWETVADSALGARGVRFRFAFEDRKVPGAKGRTLVCRGQGIIARHPDYPYLLECSYSERAFSGEPMGGPGPADAFLADVRTIRPNVRLDPSARIDSEFGMLAAGDGSVWLYQEDAAASPKSRELLRLDPRTAAVQARIPVPWHPVDVMSGEDAVWIASLEGGKVALADLGSQKVVREFRLGKDVSRLAPVPGGVWVTNFNKGELWKIDRATGKTTRVPIEGARWSMGILLHEGLLWVTAGEQILTLDPVTGERRGDPIGTALGPRALVWANDALWVLCWTGKCVQRVDPVARRVTATIPLDVLDPRALHFAAGSLWVTDIETDQIVRIDPISQAVNAEPLHPGLGIGVAALGDRLWVCDPARKVVGALVPR